MESAVALLGLRPVAGQTGPLLYADWRRCDQVDGSADGTAAIRVASPLPSHVPDPMSRGSG